ncbi:phage tail tip lysozyme [Lactococcus protaetiae]|uniref:phage tail tip lysozyme n=1 Tax=Lactococcus protaetiae TaxID=2592653 RepID=UPI001CC2051E|nr:phage tail tip lysozyme [Lactococcus protaetiae]
MKKKISVAIILAFLLLPLSVVMMGGAGGTDVSAGMTEINNAQMDEAHKIWVQGHKEGGTDEGVASLMGVWQQESGLKADAIQSGATFNEDKAMNASLGGYAFGLAQWDGGRRVNLLNFAKSENADWKDVGLQLDFAFNHDGSDSTLLKQLIKGTEVTQTVTALTQKYERAGVEAMAQRISNANYWLNTMRNEG